MLKARLPTLTLATLATIKARYHAIGDYFDFTWLCELPDIDEQIDHLAQKHYRSFDYLYAAFAAHGEFNPTQLVAKVFTHLGLPHASLIPKEIGLRVDDQARSATFNLKSYDTIKQLDLSTSERLIVPGFFVTRKMVIWQPSHVVVLTSPVPLWHVA